MDQISPFRAGLVIAALGAVLLLSYWLYKRNYEPPLPDSLLHPTPQNLRMDGAVPLSVPVGGIDIVDVVADTSSYVTIGVNEGPSHAMFGRIADVVLNSLNRVFILDNRANTVHIYRTDGTYLSSFGSSGRAPGEFDYPTSISLVDRGNKAIVTDSRVSIFASTDTSTFEFHSTFNMGYPDFSEGGACSMNGYVYTLNYRRGMSVDGIIHKYALDGTYIDSFGSAYIADRPFVVSQISSQGYLACSAPSNIVGLVRSFMPYIYGYSHNGTLLWVFRLEDFVSSGVLQGKTDDGRASLRYPAMQVGHSLHMGLDVDGHGHFLLHYITVDKTSALSRYDFTSTGHVFRIDPFTAKGTCWATLNGFTAAWGTM